MLNALRDIHGDVPQNILIEENISALLIYMYISIDIKSSKVGWEIQKSVIHYLL